VVPALLENLADTVALNERRFGPFGGCEVQDGDCGGTDGGGGGSGGGTAGMGDDLGGCKNDGGGGSGNTGDGSDGSWVRVLELDWCAFKSAGNGSRDGMAQGHNGNTNDAANDDGGGGSGGGGGDVWCSRDECGGAAVAAVENGELLRRIGPADLVVR